MDKFDEIINSVGGSHPLKSQFIGFAINARQEEKEWIASLREQGFKAAHPNDGWVDREENKITLVYPQFNDGANVGDLVMLGWASDKDKLRPVKLISKENRGLEAFFFEDVEL